MNSNGNKELLNPHSQIHLLHVFSSELTYILLKEQTKAYLATKDGMQ